MLRDHIIEEMFNLKYPISDITLNHVFDELESFLLNVRDYKNYDHVVSVKFNKDKIFGELRINRIAQRFEMTIKNDDYMMTPVYGNWETINSCLKEIICM